MKNEGDVQEDNQNKPVNQLQVTQPNVGKPKKNIFGRIWTILSILSVLAVIAVVALYSLGYLKINTTTKAVTNSYTVCDLAIVQQFNTIIASNVSSQEELDAIDAKVIDFAKTVQSKAGYSDDPTCLFISYSGAVRTNTPSSATEFIDKIDNYAKQGRFIDSRINGILSVEQMRSIIQVKTQPITGDGGEG